MKINSLIKKVTRVVGGKLVENLDQDVVLKDQAYSASAFFKNEMTRENQDEQWIDLAMSAALKSKPGILIDVGANTGQTLIKALEIDKDRGYLGFEPQLDCCFYIEQFINRNHLDKHLLMPVGLSSQSGVMTLLKRQGDIDTTASTIEGFRPDKFYTTRQAIYVVKGDEVINDLDIDEISLIKVDVEGGELEVMEGLASTLENHKPFLFFEVLNHYLAATNEPIDQGTIDFRNGRHARLDSLLRDLGYAIYNILPGDRLKEVSKLEPEVSSDLRITDYMAVYKDFVDDFFNNYRAVDR